MVLEEKYDVIVVGGGHAGCEAAHAAATLGSKVLLITQNLETLARMSCNPAMGGVAKGQIIREIDALGGMSGIITDASSIQFRMLNKSKGPAMWSPRAQCDRKLFEREWRMALEANKNIDFWQDTVENIITKKGSKGPTKDWREEIYSKTNLLKDLDYPFRVFCGGNVAFHKSIFLRTGYFDEGFQHWGGEEILVLDGTFYDEQGVYPKGTWLRSPHLSQHTPYTKDDGALIYVKTGHLS